MILRWKSRRIEKHSNEYAYGYNTKLEILRAYRDENKKPKQKYIATLGSYASYIRPTQDKKWLEIIERPSLIRIWSSMWRKTSELGLSDKDVEKIVKAIEDKTERPMVQFCYWYPPEFKSFSAWNRYLFNERYVLMPYKYKKLYFLGLINEGTETINGYNYLKDYESEKPFFGAEIMKKIKNS